jgi:hypothetical protein
MCGTQRFVQNENKPNADTLAKPVMIGWRRELDTVCALINKDVEVQRPDGTVMEWVPDHTEFISSRSHRRL